jgi:hypothetical protein
MVLPSIAMTSLQISPKPGHEFLEASTELVRIQPTEGVVTRYSASQSEKLAEEVLLGLGKHRHIHWRPGARQYGAERDHHHVRKIVASGAAGS